MIRLKIPQGINKYQITEFHTDDINNTVINLNYVNTESLPRARGLHADKTC